MALYVRGVQELRFTLAGQVRPGEPIALLARAYDKPLPLPTARPEAIVTLSAQVADRCPQREIDYAEDRARIFSQMLELGEIDLDIAAVSLAQVLDELKHDYPPTLDLEDEDDD